MPLPDFSVAGRSVLLTGAGRGIGLAIAKALAAGGAAVAVQDIDETVATAAADAIVAEGGRAIALGGDLADLSLAETLIDRTVAAFGTLDILINNGSIQHWDDDFAAHPVDRLRRETDANILMPTRLCQLAVPRMKERGWGRVINFGSVQGLRGNLSMPVYAMSRLAMTNLTIGLAKRYGRDGITANCIAPGWIHTLRTQINFPTEAEKLERGKRLTGGRVGEPDDFAGIALLLCSRAGEYINGQTIYVDGGMSL